MADQYMSDGECYRCGSTTNTTCDSCGIYTCLDHSVIDNDFDSYGGERRSCFPCAQKKSKRKESCFIATAAYGTASCSELDILRSFRDHHLRRSSPGRALVSLYYSISPPIADFIRDRSIFRRIVRFSLKPIVWLLRTKK